MNLNVALFFLVMSSWEEIAWRNERIVSIGEKCDLQSVNWAHAHCWSVKLLCNINAVIAMMCSDYIQWNPDSLNPQFCEPPDSSNQKLFSPPQSNTVILPPISLTLRDFQTNFRFSWRFKKSGFHCSYGWWNESLRQSHEKTSCRLSKMDIARPGCSKHN